MLPVDKISTTGKSVRILAKKLWIKKPKLCKFRDQNKQRLLIKAIVNAQYSYCLLVVAFSQQNH